MKKKAYAAAGVDIDLGNQVKSELPGLLAATHQPGVLGKVGGFGGLFELDVKKYRKPVLVSSADGVGTCQHFATKPEQSAPYWPLWVHCGQLPMHAPSCCPSLE